MLCIALAGLMLAAAGVGTVKIPVRDVARIMGSWLLSKDCPEIKGSHIFIVLNVRLPRILLSAIVGAALALGGTCLQGVFGNPMADPYVMGSSTGAAFGATLGIVLGLNQGLLGLGTTSVFAFCGALGTTALVYKLAVTGDRVSTTSILLAGIVVSSILSSAISLLMLFNHQQLARAVTWTMGSFNGANWQQVWVVLVPMVIGTGILLSQARELNALVMGEEDAQSLGVPVERVKKIVLIAASFLAACAVSVSGIIGFVGLIVPHLCRLIFGADHRMLLPTTAVGGGIFLLLCDTLARTAIKGVEIPVGVVTSLFGGPFFLYLLRRTK